MSQTFIPGYLAEITLNSTDVTLIGQVVSYSDDQTAVPKPTFGTRYRRTIGGQSLYSIDVSGHLAAESAAALWALKTAVGAVDWSVQIGTQGEATDGGTLEGSAIVTNLTFSDDAEGNWEWSCTLEGDGDPTYTAPAGP